MIIKPIRVLSLYCGRGPERESLQYDEYIGIDLKVPSVATRPKDSFREADLDFSKPREAIRKIKEIAPGKFDEIHIHLPIGLSFNKNIHPSALAKLGKLLRKGGVLKHSSDGASPFIQFDRNRLVRNAPLKVIQDVYNQHHAATVDFAGKCGFSVNKYYMNLNHFGTSTSFDRGVWLTSAQRSASNLDEKEVETELKRYTNHPSAVTEYFELVKK